MTEKKWCYWHLIVWVNPEIHDPKYCPGNVGTCIGLDEKTTEWTGLDHGKKGFYTTAKLKFLGRLPADYHETNPKEAMAQLDEWETKVQTE